MLCHWEVRSFYDEHSHFPFSLIINQHGRTASEIGSFKIIKKISILECVESSFWVKLPHFQFKFSQNWQSSFVAILTIKIEILYFMKKKWTLSLIRLSFNLLWSRSLESIKLHFNWTEHFISIVAWVKEQTSWYVVRALGEF